MEEKKLSEQESIELIAQMINQTKKESAVGSGNAFLIWGYLCTFMSLAVYALASINKDGRWGWLYIAIPVLGFIATGIVARTFSKKSNNPQTYQAKSINTLWSCLALMFAIYMIFCFMSWERPNSWTGMFILGLILPAIGTIFTGVILKEKSIEYCAIVGTVLGLKFLQDVCCGGCATMTWCLLMAVAMVFSLVIPGHILNHKAKKANA